MLFCHHYATQTEKDPETLRACKLWYILTSSISTQESEGNAGGMNHPQNQLQKISSSCLWESWDEALQFKEEPELLSNCQPGQTVDTGH